MIDFNTYISILFAIIIPSIGIFITLICSNLSCSKRRISLSILLFCSFILICFATLLYCFNRYFCISDLLPFTKENFTEPLFNTKYKNYFLASFGICIGISIYILCNCGAEIGYRVDGSVTFDKKYAIITLVFHFFISTYIHIWFIYALCYFSFNIFADAIMSLVVLSIEFCILYNVNKYLTLRKKRDLTSH